MNYLSIKNWSTDDRPREKLLQQGSRALSDAELIAILIGSGTRDISAVELSRKILSQNSNNLSELGKLSASDLMKIKGIGKAKAISILAALELGRRRKDSEPVTRPKITSSNEAAGIFLSLLSDIPHEEFWVAFLNRSNTLIERFQISQGGITGTVTDIRLIMKKALELRAVSVLVCHNHPSGNLEPSIQDKEITEKIKEAAKFFDIQVLDHIIIAGKNYFSFADQGLIV
jgi:DNA repair protein RadC